MGIRVLKPTMHADVRYMALSMFFSSFVAIASLPGIYSQLTGNADKGIYTAYARGEGCTGGSCGGENCKITLNGAIELDTTVGPGFYLISYKYPSFTKLETKPFKTFFAGEAAKMITWLNGLEDGTVILGCSIDDAATSMGAEGWAALAAVGLNVDNTAYRSGHALIGYKGIWPQNMRKSRSTASGVVDVTYTYVIPPAEIVPTILGSYIEVTWKKFGGYIGNYVIYANSSLGNGSADHSIIVPAKNGPSIIGPLHHDTWYTVSMKVPLSNNDTYVIPPSDPYFVILNKTSNCSTSVYQFVMKIDGNKQTFIHSATIWDDSSELLPEKNSLTGFDRLEAKSKAFNSVNVKWICAGMLDLSTNKASFIQIQTTVEQPMKDFVSNRNGFPTVPASAWNFLAPAGVPYAEDICRQGFGLSDQARIAELGFLGSSKGGCTVKSNKNVVIGYGIHMDGSNYGCGAVYIDNSGTTHFKPAFGYILIPYAVDSVWNEWSQWGSCNATCGYGTKIRTKNSTRAIGEGLQLPYHESSAASCKIVDCPPPPPTNTAVQTLAKDKLFMKWDDIPSDQMTGTLGHYEVEHWKLEDPENKTTVKVYSASQKEITGLEIYTIYCYQVHGVLASGIHGNKSDAVCNSTDESVPIAPPANITVFNSSSFCLNVTWHSIPVKQAQGIITKYRIYYKSVSEVAERYNDSKSNKSEVICGLEPYTQYTVRISGFTSKGEGVKSPASSPVFTDEYIPNGAPTITTSKNTSSTSIEIEWQSLQVTLWRGLPLGYTIFYELHDTYLVSGTRNASSFDVSHSLVRTQLTQLKKYRNYVIWMTAFTVKGRSERNSSAIEQMTDEDVPIKGPVALAHNTSSFSIKVEWLHLEVPYRLGAITGYTVFYANLKTAVNDSIDVGPSVTELEIDNLLPFHNHSFEVAASTSKGMGPRGSIAFTFTDEYLPSSWPPNFIGINISSYDLLLNWSRIPYDDWRGIPKGYTILYRETDAVGSQWNTSIVSGGDALSTVIGNLKAYTNHTLKIACRTIKGNGNFSDDIVVITAEDAPYVSPRNITQTAVGTTTAVITWQNPKADGVKGILRHYKVVYQSVYTPDDFASHLKVHSRRRRSLTAVISKEVIRHQLNITVPSDQYQVQLHNLQGYTNYSVQVLAVTLHEGPLSAPLYIFTQETVPAMSPVNVNADASSDTSLLVKWKHVPPAYAHGVIKGYIVYYEHGNQSNATAFSDKQVPSKEFLALSFLEIFAWYTIQVAAYTSVGIGVRSNPIYARTGEYYPSKAPENVSAESFLLPFEVDVTWLQVPIKSWNGIPLGYNVKLTAHSAGGVELSSSALFTITKQVPPSHTSYKFTNLMAYYKYSIQISAFNKVGDGPNSAQKYVETCSIAKTVMHSSWTDHSPLVNYKPTSSIPDGILPRILSGAVQHCSGICLGLGIKGNATVSYVTDGLGMPSRKANIQELTDKMTPDTEFFFPVEKPRFANDKFKFIELIKVDSVVLVEGQPLVNLVGSNVTSSVSGLLTVLLCFLMFCLASGCVVWMLETWKRTGQLQIFSIAGILDGFYWAWVTATTVGYGDITPVSIVGKIFSMFWSVAGLILCGFLTGSLSTLLTASENPLAASSAPKSGIGMVLNTWELRTAKRTGITVDQNFSSYSDLLDAVANGTVRYGLIDASVAKVWTPKLAKEKIDVKKELKLDGSLGVFASGHARQLYACFSTYIKEESSSILKAMQLIIQAEAVKVAKLLAVPENVTIQVTPSKPEFFSWKSQIMQAYVKGGSLTLGILWILGIIYELIRRYRRNKPKIIPKTPRRERPLKTVEGTTSRASCSTDEDQQYLENKSIHCSSGSKIQDDELQQSSSSVSQRFKSQELREGLFELGSKENIRTGSVKSSGSQRQSVEKELVLENVNEKGETVCDSHLNTTSFTEGRLTNRESISNQVKGDELPLESDSQNPKDPTSLRLDKQGTASLSDQQRNLLFATDLTGQAASQQQTGGFSNPAQQETDFSGYEVQTIPSAPPLYLKDEPWGQCDRPNLSDVPDDESILSYCKSDYYDNDMLELETGQLIADLEERFETLVLEMTRKHEREIWKQLQTREEFQRKKFGGVYRYFDPHKFSAPW